MTTSALVQQQAELQAEADEVNADPGRGDLLGRVGDPVRVGSAALGLMVRRDLDVTVVCPRLDAGVHEAVAGIGARPALSRTARTWHTCGRCRSSSPPRPGRRSC